MALKDTRVNSSINDGWVTIWSGFNASDDIHIDTFERGTVGPRFATIQISPDDALQLAARLIQAARNAKG